MADIADPTTYWVLMMLLSVVVGTFLLIAAALLRRWQQIRHSRFLKNIPFLQKTSFKLINFAFNSSIKTFSIKKIY